jgi:hypothetical protein
MKMSRRSLARLMAVVPAAAAAASVIPLESLLGPGAAAQQGAPTAEATPAPGASPAPPEETPLGKFLAKQEEDLTSEERRRVRKQVAGLEQSLKEVRAFALGNDVPPAGSFRALRSARPGRTR